MTVATLPPVEPATTYLLSGVMMALCTPPQDPDELDLLQRDRVDDVDAALRHLNGRIDLASVLADRHVVGRPVSGIFLMICSVRASTTSSVASRLVGRRRGGCRPARPRPVDDFLVRNLGHDLVGDRIDQMDAVAGGVGLDDERLARSARGSTALPPQRQRAISAGSPARLSHVR